MSAEPLAHSARDGAPEQTYRDHVTNVCRYAARFAREAGQYSPQWQDAFTAVVDLAAVYSTDFRTSLGNSVSNWIRTNAFDLARWSLTAVFQTLFFVGISFHRSRVGSKAG